MDVNRRIKLLRNITGLKQKEFSEAIGISQGNLSEMERNKFKPSIDTIISISRYFGISTEWLLKGEGEGVNSLEYITGATQLQSLREANDENEKYTAVFDDERDSSLPGNQLDLAILHKATNLNTDEKRQVLQYIKFLEFQRTEVDKE
ncbi:MAG: helix-turn-helix transcriptional regulator [Firmicutes bacterium]|nr:helix-turn-helix transcriptional regulator [Bacillota bacterium]